MRVKFFNLIFIFLIAVQFSCGQNLANENKQSQNPKNDYIKLQNLKVQATEMFKALYDDKNYEKALDLTYHPIPEMKQNPEFRQTVIQNMKDAVKFAEETFETWSWSISDPTELVKLDDKIFGVIPKALKGITHKGNNVVQESCTIGISDDNGNSWKFAECKGFIKIYPNVAEKVQIPQQKTFVNGIEQ